MRRLILVVVAVDLLLKFFCRAVLTETPFKFGPLTFQLVRNYGAVMSLGDKLPAGSIALLGIVIAAICALGSIGMQIYLPRGYRTLYRGVALLSGGFFANAFDRLLNGFVTDLLTVSGADLPSVNVADLIQWLGYFMIIYMAFYGYWSARKRERRFILLVNRDYQLKFCLYLQAAMSMGFLPMFLAGLVGFGPSRSLFSGELTSTPLLKLYLGLAVVSYLSLSALCWLIGIAISNRTAGPVKKFEQTVDQHLAGAEPTILKLRKGDHFAAEFERMAKRIQGK